MIFFPRAWGPPLPLKVRNIRFLWSCSLLFSLVLKSFSYYCFWWFEKTFKNTVCECFCQWIFFSKTDKNKEFCFIFVFKHKKLKDETFVYILKCFNFRINTKRRMSGKQINMNCFLMELKVGFQTKAKILKTNKIK